MKKCPKKELELYKNQYSSIFEKLILLADLKNNGKNEQYTDPESKTVRLILWLFTIEPSFYADLNDASIEQDEQKVEMLGPFARAIFLVLTFVELNRVNKTPFGMENEFDGDPLGVFNQAFLLFRGTTMTSECINDWRDLVKRESISTMGEIMAKYICLKGNTSTSESF